MSVVETLPSPSPLQWGPVLAGAALGTAIGLVLLGFGAALGLSFASPYEGEGFEPAAFAIAAGLYLLWVQITSFYCGGYVAARLCLRGAGLSEHEADVRDGLHGLLVWSIGVIAAGVIAYVGIGGIGAATLAEPSAVSQAVGQEVEESAAQEAQANPEAAPESADERRAEIARKWSVIAAFISAASLLVGAVAAFFGAQSGGNHRDDRVTLVFFTSQARVRPPSP
jgi:hypothetical protein